MRHKLTLLILAMLIGVLSLSLFCGMTMKAVGETGDDKEVLILMYHNIIPNSMKPNKYEVTLSELERDFQFIHDNGYTTVTPAQLIAYTNGTKNLLPSRLVMVTFDDGFYNYNKYLEPLLDKYDINCTISVVCGFSVFNKNTAAIGRYIYMDYDDIAAIAANPRVEIAGHSNDLHWQNKGRLGAKKKKDESSAEYVKVLNADCDKMEQNLAKIGIKPSCYTYPYGAFCSDSESVLKERGYKMTLVCEEKVNKITRNPDNLYKLGRYNRSGCGQGAQQIISSAWKTK